MAHPQPPRVTIGVDTHKNLHVAAARDQLGRRLGTTMAPATGAGYAQLLAWARGLGEPVAWGVEGTGSYGAGLARFLATHGQRVWEVNRPDRATRRRCGKSDPVDADAAARTVQAGEASGTPKTQDGAVEMVRALRVARPTAVKARTQAINALKGLLVTAPSELRQQLEGLSTAKLIRQAAALDPGTLATLHRLLQLRPGGDAAFDRDHPLDADLVVVDEASMLDVLLANKLIKAIPPGAHLLFVGDVDQLPSVGAGEVLRDLLAAERLPRVRLTKVFRQAQQSGVVTNAHRINAGQHPITHGLNDFFLFAEEDAEQVADLVVDIVANRLPRRFGLDPGREVQVLCPMHRGPAGAGVLNERLQAALTQRERGFLSGASVAASTGSGTRSCSSGTTMTRAPPGCSTARSGRSPPSRSRTKNSMSCWMRTRRWPTGSTNSMS
jgi:AAA domain/Transposase